MRSALAESVPDRRLVMVPSVRRNLRCADHALAQVLNEIVRHGPGALAGAIADDRAAGRAQSDERVLVAAHRRRMPHRTFLWIALVADVGPELVAFDAVDTQADHQAVVQFGAASAHPEGNA